MSPGLKAQTIHIVDVIAFTYSSLGLQCPIGIRAWPPLGHGLVVCLSRKSVQWLVEPCRPHLSGSITWMSLSNRHRSFQHKTHRHGQALHHFQPRNPTTSGLWPPLASGPYEDIGQLRTITVVTPSTTQSRTSFMYFVASPLLVIVLSPEVSSLMAFDAV